MDQVRRGGLERQVNPRLTASLQPGRTMGHMTRGNPTPEVLFVCVHNAGRSQMAAGFLRHLAGDRVKVSSAGSMPVDRVNPAVLDVMAERGIDLTGNLPTRLSTDRAADVVVTIGCGDSMTPPGRTPKRSDRSETRSKDW